MTLTNIITRILERCGRSGDTTLTDAATYALESVQDEITTDIIFPELLAWGIVELEAGNASYDLPNDFNQMLQVWDSTTRINELKRLSPHEYRTYMGDATASGSLPQFYDILGSSTVGATYVKGLLLLPVPASYTNGIIASFAQITGVAGCITAFTDYNTTVAGAVQITDVAHGLQTGMQILLAGTTAYNGSFEVTVIDADNFYIMATYVAEAPAGANTWTALGTVITDVGHGLANDDYIIISGTTNYDGSYNIIYMTANTFYINETYVAEVPTNSCVWTISSIVPYVYRKNLAYLSTTNTENTLSYMYPQLYIEGGAYYLYRDVIYRDQPEKIAFRRAEFERVKKQVQGKIIQPDKISAVLPKRLTNLMGNKYYRTQYQGYTS